MTEASYDAVPYGVATHPATHPTRLATVATLFGGSPPPVQSSRVLELGCARGGNLIPMAVAYPHSMFVGVDVSSRQIVDGAATVARLSLSNVDLRHASILDIDESYGEFDYVLCHGVFAWVEQAVQDKILDICAEHLAADGVAYISYNTYPGWHFRGMIREMLLYHAERFDDPDSRISAARTLLAFLAQSAGRTGSYGQILNSELELLAKLPDFYVFHEHLEQNNQPMYFHQFCQRLAGRGLQYLGEADVSSMGHFTFPKPVQEVLKQLAGNVVQAEQYMDFLRNRMFRQTLLVRDSIPLSRNLTPAVLPGFSLMTMAEETGAASGGVKFTTPGGESLTTRDQVLADALRRLREACPIPVPFDELVATVAASLNMPPDHVGSRLGLSVLRLYLSSRILELHVAPPPFVVELNERPAASPLARMQAAAGAQVTNLRHESVRLGDIDRHVVMQLDGTRSPREVLDAMHERALRGTLGLRHEGVPVNDPAEALALLDTTMPQVLHRLATAALLVS